MQNYAWGKPEEEQNCGKWRMEGVRRDSEQGIFSIYSKED
jgi:hypothetical protein